MQFICDAPNRKAWFRIETEAEALAESELMRHAVEKYFRREYDAAKQDMINRGVTGTTTRVPVGKK